MKKSLILNACDRSSVFFFGVPDFLIYERAARRNPSRCYDQYYTLSWSPFLFFSSAGDREGRVGRRNEAESIRALARIDGVK